MGPGQKPEDWFSQVVAHFVLKRIYNTDIDHPDMTISVDWGDKHQC